MKKSLFISSAAIIALGSCGKEDKKQDEVMAERVSQNYEAIYKAGASEITGGEATFKAAFSSKPENSPLKLTEESFVKIAGGGLSEPKSLSLKENDATACPNEEIQTYCYVTQESISKESASQEMKFIYTNKKGDTLDNSFKFPAPIKIPPSADLVNLATGKVTFTAMEPSDTSGDSEDSYKLILRDGENQKTVELTKEDLRKGEKTLEESDTREFGKPATIIELERSYTKKLDEKELASGEITVKTVTTSAKRN